MTRGLCGALGYDYEALHDHLSFTSTTQTKTKRWLMHLKWR